MGESRSEMRAVEGRMRRVTVRTDSILPEVGGFGSVARCFENAPSSKPGAGAVDAHRKASGSPRKRSADSSSIAERMARATTSTPSIAVPVARL